MLATRHFCAHELHSGTASLLHQLATTCACARNNVHAEPLGMPLRGLLRQRRRVGVKWIVFLPKVGQEHTI